MHDHLLAGGTNIATIAGVGAAFCAVVILFGILTGMLGHSRDRARTRRAIKRVPHTTTVHQERTRIAMEEALRNTQQNQPPAARPSLSSRLAQLDDVLRAGQITQQEYTAARAAILASP